LEIGNIVSKKYHFLRKGEIIRKGDEYKGWNPECTKMIWIPITRKGYKDLIGTKRKSDHAKVRRKK